MNVLEEPALVLNRNWSLVAVTTAADAICKLYQDTARVVHADDYSVHDFRAWSLREIDVGKPVICTPKLVLQVPEVIVLTAYDRLPQHELAFSRYHVFKRDHYVCQYCGAQVGREHITLDHVLPRAQGGITAWDNCVSACESCNASKADRTPKQAGMRLRSRPHKPVWSAALIVRRYREQKDCWQKFLPAGE